MKTPLVVSLAKLVLFLGSALMALNHRANALPGDLDLTFGTAGKVTTALGVVARMNGVALQADGKIVVVGYYFASGPPLMTQTNVVLRYNSDGSLDTTFNGTGIVILGTNAYGQSKGVAIQSDGKILVVGSSLGISNNFLLVRLNANGSVDFQVTTDFFNGSTNAASAESVAVQNDGKIVVAGRAGRPDFAVARYNSDGSLDTTFGGGGKVITQSARTGGGKSIALQSDGKIVVAGYYGPSGGFGKSSFALVRYNANGSVDFEATTDFGSGDDSGNSVVLQNRANFRSRA